MKQFFRACLLLLILLMVGYLAIRVDVDRAVAPYILSAGQLTPSNTTAVVLGAEVIHDNTPSQALAERLQTAISLYKSGKVTRLLMSGDGVSSPYYNEVKVMVAYAIAAGVPKTAIDADTEGLRTYDTCYRLQNVYHFDRVILITQPDHLKRAVYTCRELGLDAIGVTTTGPANSLAGDPDFFWHEQGAIILAWFDVHILHPVPKNYV